MSSQAPELHIYDREIEADKRSSLSVLASHIAPGARVLDLGCGSGAIGRFLAARDGAAAGPCDGLTISEDEAQLARAHYRRIEVADLDQCRLPELFPPGSYDVIVCADVLEHIRHSERVLTECRDLLAPGGRVLLSIPNAGYCGLVAELMEGEFRYRKEGLLDETHVRFFTRRTLLRFLADNGWVADSLETVTRQLPDSEFRVAFDALPPAVARHLLALPDALTYQFVVVARPALAGEVAAPPQDSPELPARAVFTAQLFLGEHGDYAESRKIIAQGVIGQTRQTIRFPLPTDAFSSLRLDPADRPGFLHLHALRLRSHDGDVLWHWHGDDVATLRDARQSGIVAHAPGGASTAFQLLLHGDDPWIELPIDPALASRAAGGALEMEVGWPMSADYMALAGAAQQMQLNRDRVDAEHARLEQQLRDARNTHEAQQQALQQKLRAQHEQLEVEIAQLRTATAHNAELRRRNQELLARTHTLDAERNEAFQLVRSIENSTVFRATRPLVHTKMWLDQRLGRRPSRPLADMPRPAEPLAAGTEPVDIILPVYRGLADTQLSVRSVLASSCRTPWRLVIINDASPEPAVTDWLRENCADDPRILLLENEVNLGFVGTVNRGMALSGDRDVLLLNSDTEVAADWLDRIRAAAYSDQKIASVTPFSNNATICSYPRFCQDNTLPHGWSLAELDALCASSLAGQTVDVPTGVGFCMYIRRAALDAVGLFDVENFGKGYGEENDFCVRASQAGWRHLHALDTFVFHSGGVSFGAGKTPGERAAMETMRRLHPRYEQQIIRFVQQDPAAVARAVLDFARVTSRDLPVILAITHDREGGTLQHVQQLADTLAAQASMLRLRPVAGQQVGLSVAARDTSGAELRFELPDEFDLLIDTLRGLGVRHLHFHHLLGHHPVIRDHLAQRLAVTHDFTVHDFYPACPQISMIGVDGAYCGELGLQQCNDCLLKNPAPQQVDISTWRRQHATLLEGARHVIAPSADALRRLRHYVPLAHHVLAPHPESSGDKGDWPTPQARPLAGDAPLKVTVLGALSVIKGADTLEDVAVAARRAGAPVEFHLLGYGYRALRTQPQAALSVHGAYRDGELPALLDWLKPDLIWFPARVPETYSYTLSAALRAGLPVVAPNLGAFPERLAQRPWSWVEPWDHSVADWLSFFTNVREQYFVGGQSPTPPSGMQALNPADPTIPTPAVTDARWYQQTYLEGLPAAAPAAALPRALIEQRLASTQPSPGGSGGKGAALSLLARLRAAPVLAPVARSIPPGWQRRVKNWLTR